MFITGILLRRCINNYHAKTVFLVLQSQGYTSVDGHMQNLANDIYFKSSSGTPCLRF